MATYETKTRRKVRHEITGETDTLTIIVERDKKTHEHIKTTWILDKYGDMTAQFEAMAEQWAPIWDSY